MSQLEQMRLMKIIIPILMMVLTEFLEPVFVWGKRIMINIEGEIK